MSTLTKWNPFPSTRWNPFYELEEIERRLESLFQRTPLSRGREETSNLLEWSPQVDIIENEKEFLVKADLPQVERNQVKVSVRDGVLEISGERKAETEEKGRRFHRIERTFGSFQRSFTLPAGSEGEKARAEFRDGVLTVHIPKNEKSTAKSIEIKVG